MSTYVATRRLPTASSSSRSSLSISSADDHKKFSRPHNGDRGRDDGRRRRLSLMPPGPQPEADGQLSSIHDSDNTSVIKHKINSKPIRGDATEEYQTTKKVNITKSRRGA